MRATTQHLITHTLFFAPLTAGLAVLVPMAVRLLPVDQRFVRASAVAVLVAGALFFALVLVRGLRGKGWLFPRPVSVRHHLRGFAITVLAHGIFLFTTAILVSSFAQALTYLVILAAFFASFVRYSIKGFRDLGWPGDRDRYRRHLYVGYSGRNRGRHTEDEEDRFIEDEKDRFMVGTYDCSAPVPSLGSMHPVNIEHSRIAGDWRR